ncbi:PREDICTED: GRIP and coiled-coil domain-containing protein 2-like [Amphimedon queenslandica]|uniref:GRIP domain-containing protein n=1 Tax=Amphimedon queenslandica TaxID=400682 RepID=A0A1X7UV40_AMPQE|nr:PREDICTED: GRIP and coiled-coil domain-containing protein 2-like [Amphimedon queenslandica]|eukprot:XP_019852106.1 PREDICTED: GRIP and coiled-coil domain-containing protein 2-like [Amphimedon queenslandica]
MESQDEAFASSEEATPNRPHMTSTKGKISVETLSRDDLIKQIKKQSLMLQKMKSKFDEISQEYAKLKNESRPTDNEHLVNEIQVLKAENDQQKNELRNVKQIVLSVEEEKKAELSNLNDQLSEALSQKSLLQEELSTLKLSMETELAAYQKEKLQLELKAADLESLIKEGESTKKDLLEDVASMKETCEKLTTECNNSRIQTMTLEEELAKKSDTWAYEKEEMTNHVKQLVTDKETLQANFKEELFQCKQREDELISEVERLSKEKEQLHLSIQGSSHQKSGSEELVEDKKMNVKYQELKEDHDLLLIAKEKLEKDLAQQLQNFSARDDIVATLRSEVESLSNQLSHETAVHKEEIKKLKAYAVKLKRELSESLEKEKPLQEEVRTLTQALIAEKAKFNDMTSSMNESLSDYDNLSQQLIEEKKNKEELLLMLSKLTEEKAMMEDAHNTSRSELEAIKATSLNFQSQLTESSRKLNEVAAENEILHETLAKEKEELAELKQKLTMAEKDAKVSSMMNLELADYERSVETLRGQVKEKEVQQVELEKEVASWANKYEELSHELTSCKEDSFQKDEIITKMKSMLRKSTKELTEAKAQITENHQKSNDTKTELETTRQDLEMTKVEIARLTAAFQSDLEQSQSSVSHYKQLINVLEMKVTSLQTELKTSSELLQLKEQEFENYKVRVHSVLKQKQTMPSLTEVESNLRQQHEAELLKTKSELIETRERLTNLYSDHSNIEQEHQALISTHNSYVHENELKLQHLHERLQECEEKYVIKTRQLDDLVSQLRLEIAENTAAFKSQIYTLQKDHELEISSLQDELKIAYKNLNRFQQESDSAVLSKVSSTSASSQISQVKENMRPTGDMKVLPTEERSSGEGMDRSELEVLGLSLPVVTPTPQRDEDKFVSFENLLNNSSNELSSLSGRSLSPKLDTLEDLKDQVATLTKRVSHLTGILHESEANCVRYIDQSKLLKEEIRRLERNQERQKEASSNMEYLKNVTLKFLHTNNEEKLKLIPIITRLLQLSQQEKHFLQETIKGRKTELPDPTGDSDNSGSATGKGWTNYLQRWTGY